MKSENKLGAVITQIDGYRVREVFDKKKQIGFGIYTGKKLFKGGFKTVEDAKIGILEILHK